MILTVIKDADTLEEAAEMAAGNWQEWRCFVWWGESDVPQPDKVMLGYTDGPQSGLTDMANHEVIAKALAPFLGDIREFADAETFGSSLSGDSNALKGFMVRVYDRFSGEITPAFRRLYLLSQKLDDNDGILSQAAWDRINRRELLRYVGGEVAEICRDKNIPNAEGLTVDVVNSLIEQEINYDVVSIEDIESELAEYS